MSGDWLTATEATALLGVKPATLYAYVSRGLLRRERDAGGRASRYAREDVERLGARRRPAAATAQGADLTVESAVTLLDPAGRLAYRGWDAADAAADGFEVVAHWLWTGERRRDPEAVELPLPLAPPLPGDLAGLDLLRAAVITARARAGTGGETDRRAGAVAETGRTIVAAMIDALPALQAPVHHTTAAARLWVRLTDQRPRLRDLDLLDAALVVLADHELAQSTLAARVTASTWADPYLVVLAGLCALGAPRHGAGAESVRGLLRAVDRGEDLDGLLDAAEGTPGFGHRTYRVRDPRAEHLFTMLPANGAVDALAGAAKRRRLPFRNVDLALASMAESFGMVTGAGELVRAVARTAGWLAHAVEEYERPHRYPSRVTYVGR